MTTDDTSDGDEVPLQNHGTDSRLSSKICDG